MNPVTEALAKAEWTVTGRLDLSGLRLRELPDVFAPEMAIRELDLSGNQLTALPASLFRLTHLTHLDLGNNRLRALPPDIGTLTRLTRLDVSENRLAGLPPELATCVALRDIHLYGNLLTELTPLAEVPDLATLDAAGNRLRTLSGLPTGLVALDLSGNQLTELPDGIRELTRLSRLDLSGNQLTRVDALAVLRCTELHLDSNALTEWPHAVATMPTLRTFSALDNPAGEPDAFATEVREFVRANSTGHADPAKQYLDAATISFAFSLATTGAIAIRALVDRYYKRLRGVGAVLTLADGTRLELTGLSYKSVQRIVRNAHATATSKALMDFRPTKDAGTRQQVERFVVETAVRAVPADLVAKDGTVIHIHNYNPEYSMGDTINVVGNTNANINVKASLTGVTQTVGTATALDGDAKAELTRLLGQLEAALARLPAEQAEDAQAIAESTADLVDKATRDKPNKKLVTAAITGLRTLVDGLTTVAPIALGIIGIVAKIVGA